MFIGIGFAVIAVVFALRFRAALKEYRRNEPVRREVRGHPVTYRTGVVVRICGPSGESTLRGTLDLIVRGEFLEISHPLRPVAVLFGQEFYFRATDLRIETYWDQRKRIRITDVSYGRDASLSVANRTDLDGIWRALVNAGAVPVGPASHEPAGRLLPEPAPEVAILAGQGRKIQAIKRYRELNPGIGLKQAKDVIDGLEPDRGRPRP